MATFIAVLIAKILRIVAYKKKGDNLSYTHELHDSAFLSHFYDMPFVKTDSFGTCYTGSFETYNSLRD